MADANHKQATLHDVARLANVSHQTVSRVINQSPNVAPETRERVLQAIEILNYRPNRAARSLITGRSQTIQIIDYEANYVAPIPTIVAIAGEMGYRSGVSILREASRKELHQLFDELTSWLVDGIILFHPQMGVNPEELRQMCRGIPIVQLGGEPSPEVPCVVFDQAAGVRMILDHLYALGHRKIAEISGPINTYDGRVRHQTYLDWMASYGLQPALWREGDFAAPKAYACTGELLEAGSFTALICGNDITALGALHALHQRGFRVPEDISVVGFDDSSTVQFYEPPLTTVRQDSVVLSRAGLADLIARIQDPLRMVVHQVLEPQLIIRESTHQAR